MKYYGREEALLAMWDLKDQGYVIVELCIREDRTLLLSCSGKKNDDWTLPNLEGDFIDSYLTSPGEENAPGFKLYWWIFD